jgi:succinate-semialdehyde dehydrogenase/glutarate-semialdehyde dehydrogenase
MSPVVTLDPATGERLAECATFSDAEVEGTLERADEAQPTWAALPIGERAVVLRRVAAILRTRDLGGSASTTESTDAVVAAFGS